MLKSKSLKNTGLNAAKDEWQESFHDKRKHKAMRDRRKSGRGKAWQVAV